MPAAGPRQSFHVDVISDVVCPWCFIGKRRLEKAIAMVPELRVTVAWRPYQLDPHVPPGGLDRRVYMERKFGSRERLEAIHQRLAAEGEKEGLAFRFDLIRRTPNTLDAHRLIGWAAPLGLQDAVVEALFRAFFMEGRDVGDRAVLADIAASCGMDGAAARLAGADDATLVSAAVEQARDMGVSGVPCFILAERLALPGAQDPETIARYMRRMAQKLKLEAVGTGPAGACAADGGAC
ncbi:DsbA family oxidoreductase [Camelimonas abortus]|uniref:DsbA family oxidoreductase n=1 Tax=Camelimonas abortus TaxID=1017184 RepID=A0ABV7LE58_9HYPH